MISTKCGSRMVISRIIGDRWTPGQIRRQIQRGGRNPVILPLFWTVTRGAKFDAAEAVEMAAAKPVAFRSLHAEELAFAVGRRNKTPDLSFGRSEEKRTTEYEQATPAPPQVRSLEACRQRFPRRRRIPLFLDLRLGGTILTGRAFAGPINMKVIRRSSR
jgi:hypothetical protein